MDDDTHIIGKDSDDEEPKGSASSGPEIHVDEDWKEQAKREKDLDARAAAAAAEEKQEAQPGGGRPGEPLPEPSLTHLIMSFATQAFFGLGEAVNPISNKKEIDLEWAKFNIDMLQMLEDKTRNNTTPEEKNLLVQILYDLRMRYVKAVG